MAPASRMHDQLAHLLSRRDARDLDPDRDVVERGGHRTRRSNH
jgi:hypothetical protein